LDPGLGESPVPPPGTIEILAKDSTDRRAGSPFACPYICKAPLSEAKVLASRMAVKWHACGPLAFIWSAVWHTFSGQNFRRWNVNAIWWTFDWLISDTLVFVCTQTSQPLSALTHATQISFTLGPPLHRLHLVNNPEIGLKGKSFLAQFRSCFTSHAPLLTSSRSLSSTKYASSPSLSTDQISFS